MNKFPPTDSLESNLQKLESVIEKIDSLIVPTAKESEDEKKVALKIAHSIQEALNSFSVKVFLVGSTARDTGLRGERDIDLFVCFPQTFSKDEIVSHTFKATKMSVIADWQTHYASHPYLQSVIEGYAVEVIPCFIVLANQPIKSAVDRSPLHMDYLQKRLTLSQKRDVRVLKKLLKTAGIYGAESSIGGFSGLLCEYMILNYRSLIGLLTSASKWIPPVIIDLEGTRTQNESDIIKLKEQFSTPLILIDAIDFNRNVSASVGLTAFSSFVSIANSLLSNPSETFFLNEKSKPQSSMDVVELEKQVEKRGTSFIALTFPLPNSVVDDIVFPQIRKTVQSIHSKLLLEDFNVIDYHLKLYEKQALVFFELQSGKRTKIKKISGPPAYLFTPSLDFLSNHPPQSILRGPYIDGERIVIEVLRNIIDSDKFLVELLKTENAISIGPDIKESINRGKVYSHIQFMELLKLKESEFARFALEEYLFKRSFWL